MDLTRAVWHKSTRSGSAGECVEVADNLAAIVVVRDSKDPDAGSLVFTPAQWDAFVSGVKAGDFDS